jgi:hypothetical protein
MHRNWDYPPHRAIPSKRIVNFVSSLERVPHRYGSLCSHILVAQASQAAEKCFVLSF